MLVDSFQYHPYSIFFPFPLGDILRALGCNVTNAAVASHGGTEALGEKRIAFADFGAILTAVKADTSSTGVKEDYIEGLKVGNTLLPRYHFCKNLVYKASLKFKNV